ncbi:Uu.00g004110.m01.CDS01 [Anthostomella pinea]|uniref:Uu.00g004110.m01.CDS01 n=1 Tax=Anthostomella pinea TaxID=933095 RepID=A0AAI8VKV1_9PEZI|nr:Uu.00g004110.m01.CDS01 [Anthostomella pinea]
MAGSPPQPSKPTVEDFCMQLVKRIMKDVLDEKITIKEDILDQKKPFYIECTQLPVLLCAIPLPKPANPLIETDKENFTANLRYGLNLLARGAKGWQHEIMHVRWQFKLNVIADKHGDKVVLEQYDDPDSGYKCDMCKKAYRNLPDEVVKQDK